MMTINSTIKIPVVVLAIVLIAITSFPSRAGAAPANAGVFDCLGRSEWPASWGFCQGALRGHFEWDGATLECIPQCFINMEFHTTEVICVASEPPMVQTWEGLLTVSDGRITIDEPFYATVVGHEVTLSTAGPWGGGNHMLGYGAGTVVPIDARFPTCRVWGPIDIRFVGELVLSSPGVVK